MSSPLSASSASGSTIPCITSTAWAPFATSPALLEIEELNAIQWTPGVGQPQGGDPCWYDLYKRIKAGGKAIMASWVEVDELKPLLDAVGPEGVHVLMHFETEHDIDRTLEIVEAYR